MCKFDFELLFVDASCDCETFGLRVLKWKVPDVMAKDLFCAVVDNLFIFQR